MLNNIICFGDSNTHGFVAGIGGRYNENTRWMQLTMPRLMRRMPFIWTPKVMHP